MARKPKDISPEIREIICTLVGAGDSDRKVAKIVRIEPKTWKALAARDKGFSALLEKAEVDRGGGLASLLRGAMQTMIKKGHPWWAKLAIHNYNTGLRDPDVQSGAKLKRMIDRASQKPADASDLIETDEAVASATIPLGAIPAVPQPGTIPDSSGGASFGQNRGGEA